MEIYRAYTGLGTNNQSVGMGRHNSLRIRIWARHAGSQMQANVRSSSIDS
jgi:hypothetical protein